MSARLRRALSVVGLLRGFAARWFEVALMVLDLDNVAAGRNQLTTDNARAARMYTTPP